MTDEKLAKKLRKRAKKLAKLAKRHGVDHVDMFVIGPTEDDPRWYADATAHVGDVRAVSIGDFYREDKL